MNSGKKEKNVKVNYLLNVIYRVFSVLIPIISTPYLSKILGADGIGQYSYAATYSNYFCCFAMLGFSYYGQRLIASHRSDKNQMRVDFWELFICKTIVSSFATVLFALFAVFQPFGERYLYCFLAEIIMVASNVTNVNFFLEGNEEFAKITIRDAIIKTLSIVAIFIFVKHKNDVWIYSVILAASSLVSTITVWPYIVKKIGFIIPSRIKPFRHMKPCLILFFPTIASKIYPLIDKTLIGLITKSDAEVGNYAKAQQIVDTCTGFMIALGTVMAPRNAYLFAKGKIEELKNNIYKSIRFVWMAAVPMCFGIISIAQNFVPWYLNDSQFTSATFIMMILSITILLSGFRNVFGVQLLISSGQDKKFTISIIGGVAINIILSVPLVFALHNYGAAIASVVAEFSICLLMFLFARKEISFKKLFKSSKNYLISGLLMFFVCFPASVVLENKILYTIVIAIVGAIIYLSSLFVLEDEYLIGFIDKFSTKLTKILKIFSSNKYQKIVLYYFYFVVCISALCYCPLFRRFNLNNYLFILWIILTFLIVPISIKVIPHFFKKLFVIYLPFVIYILSTAAFLEKDILFSNMTKIILMSAFLLAVGCLISPILGKKQIEILLILFFITNIISAFDLFIEYFRGFDFAAKNYVYAEKNAISPLLLISAAIPFFKKQRSLFIFCIELFGSAFLLVIIAMLKCRAVIISIPIIVLILSRNKSFHKNTFMISIISMLLFMAIVFIVPQLRTLIINNILLANNVGSLDNISSGRLSLIEYAFSVFKISPIVGMGHYYIDFAPLELMIIYGVFGLLLLIPSLSIPFIVYFKSRSCIPDCLKYLSIVSIVIIYINGLFEAYSPYGPGVRAFIVWVFCGVSLCYSDRSNIKKSQFEPIFERGTIKI